MYTLTFIAESEECRRQQSIYWEPRYSVAHRGIRSSNSTDSLDELLVDTILDLPGRKPAKERRMTVNLQGEFDQEKTDRVTKVLELYARAEGIKMRFNYRLNEITFRYRESKK